MHPRLGLNSLSTAGWPLERDLELYVDLDVHRAGLYLDKVLACGEERAVGLISAAGLRVDHLFARGVVPRDPGSWAEDRRRLLGAVELAAELGVPVLTITTGPAGPLGWDEASAALAEALGPVLAEARRRSMTVAIEQTLPVRVEVGFVHSFRDSADLADRIGLGVVLEAGYCFAERDLGRSVHSAGKVLTVVQLSDLVIPSNAIPDRAVPGDGVIPLEWIVTLA
ncbi:MAG TPA: TIM barrel protein, partial [Acidimicrobiales bacterium]|nr:TIM barrel protein [Acidimicrobiales bacterium]